MPITFYAETLVRLPNRLRGGHEHLQKPQEFACSSLSAFWNLFASIGLRGFRKSEVAVTEAGARAKWRNPENTLSFKDHVIKHYVQLG